MKWPVGWGEREAERVERLAHSNKIYQAYSDKLRCGEIELAGRAVAVPFVGAVAGSLVIAETLRMQQGGVRCGSARVQLDASEERIIRCLGTYTGAEQPLLAAQALKQTYRIA